MPTPQQLDWLHTVCAPAAAIAERETGLPGEFQCAQAIFESAWGTRGIGNNVFGIKADAHGSGVKYVLTEEYLDGTWESEPLAFETYASVADCFTDHARLITQGAPYQAAWRQFQIDKHVNRLILAVGPIYATAPGYAQTIMAEAGAWYVASAMQAARSSMPPPPQ